MKLLFWNESQIQKSKIKFKIKFKRSTEKEADGIHSLAD